MSETYHGQHGNEGQEGNSEPQGVPESNIAYWKREYQDLRFWIAFVLMLAAITIHVLNYDLAFLPRGRPFP